MSLIDLIDNEIAEIKKTRKKLEETLVRMDYQNSALLNLLAFDFYDAIVDPFMKGERVYSTMKEAEQEIASRFFGARVLVNLFEVENETFKFEADDTVWYMNACKFSSTQGLELFDARDAVGIKVFGGLYINKKPESEENDEPPMIIYNEQTDIIFSGTHIINYDSEFHIADYYVE